MVLRGPFGSLRVKFSNSFRTFSTLKIYVTFLLTLLLFFTNVTIIFLVEIANEIPSTSITTTEFPESFRTEIFSNFPITSGEISLQNGSIIEYARISDEMHFDDALLF